jgi:hypothetical protein
VDETQPDVEVTSGIYTVALGSVTSLSLPFNEDYYLGVKVGTTPEMSPRARLTIAPYALSLKGNSNLLPSTGTVGGGTVTPNSNYLLHLNNASGAADERLEGTTGAGLTLKREPQNTLWAILLPTINSESTRRVTMISMSFTPEPPDCL